MNMVTGGCGLGKIFLEFKERSVSLSISCFPGFNLVAKPRQSKGRPDYISTFSCKSSCSPMRPEIVQKSWPTCICSSESHPAASYRVDHLHVWWEQQRRGSLLPAAPLIPEVMVAMAMMARRRPHDSVICLPLWVMRPPPREWVAHLSAWWLSLVPACALSSFCSSAQGSNSTHPVLFPSLLHPLSLKHAANWIYVVCICNRIITGRRPVWTQSEGEFQVWPTDKRLATASNTCTRDPLSPSTQFRLIWQSAPIEHRVENLCKPWPGPGRWSSQWITFCMCGMFKAKKVGI